MNRPPKLPDGWVDWALLAWSASLAVIFMMYGLRMLEG